MITHADVAVQLRADKLKRVGLKRKEPQLNGNF